MRVFLNLLTAFVAIITCLYIMGFTMFQTSVLAVLTLIFCVLEDIYQEVVRK